MSCSGLDRRESPETAAPLRHFTVARPGPIDLAITRLERLSPLEMFECDPDRIAQLLANLITNALHHGASTGPVIVTAQTGNGHFELAVHNRGTPIAAEHLPRLFDRFYRSEALTCTQCGHRNPRPARYEDA